MRYLNMPYDAACPICLHTQNKLLYTVTSKEAAKHFIVAQGLNDRDIDIVETKIANVWKKRTASVVACTNCDFVFADPFTAGDSEFYNLLPHAAGDGDVHWKWEFDKTYSEIKKLVVSNPNISLLEIGASTGGFIKRTAGLVPKENILCLEHSQIGVNSIKKAGINAQSWHFNQLPPQPQFLNKFDVICLFQVLEHLDEFDQTFATFNAISTPGAHIFIGVPNGRKIKFNELNDALLDMPPNHIGRFNEYNLSLLGKNHGWAVEEIAIEPYQPIDVMKTVMYYQSLKRAQYPPAKETTVFKLSRYLGIKYLRLQSFFRHKQLGEALWVHFKKAA